MALLVGCSGWSYKDWIGPFYPKEVKQKEWLEYYGRFFPTVEINSTFYAVPNRYTVEAWIRKGRAVRRQREAGGHGTDFKFSLKLPQTITHDLLVKGKVKEALEETREFQRAVLDPLHDFGLVGAVLVQTSPYFRYDRKDGKRNLEALSGLFEALDLERFDCAVEFRHRTWADQKRRRLEKLVGQLLVKHDVALCETDGPGFPDLRLEGTRRAYIRFHGRNEDIWFKKGSGSSNGMDNGNGDLDGAGRFNRYDYLYSTDELEGWAHRIGKLAQDDDDEVSYVYFNNHPRGKGPRNALMLMDMLGVAHEPKEVKIISQQSLF
jgi:uncharacterized protein YecE (DUF72 family)